MHQLDSYMDYVSKDADARDAEAQGLDFFEEPLPDLFDVQFTQEMERIENGKKQ